MVNSDQFRQVMGNFATGITVVTTRDKEGKPYGLTVNSFTAVSLNPVLVLVCLDLRLSGLQSFRDSRHFGVSILSEHQEDISRMFAKKDAERPADIFFEGTLGMPLLKNAVAIGLRSPAGMTLPAKGERVALVPLTTVLAGS